MNFKIYSDIPDFQVYESSNVSIDEFLTMLDNLDWNNYYQIVLAVDDSNWLEIDGVLNKEELSCSYAEQQNVCYIDKVPESIGEIKDLILLYYHDAEQFKRTYNKQSDIDEVLNTYIKPEKHPRKIRSEKRNVSFAGSLKENKIFSAILILVTFGGLIILKTVKLPLIVYYIYVFAVILLWGIAFIKAIRAEKLKERAKETELKNLKSSIKSNQLRLNPLNIPEQFAPYIYLFEKWGVNNKLLREDLYEEATEDELQELKTIEAIIPELEKYIAKYTKKDYAEKEAIKLTIKAYYDLGLWTSE